MFFLSNFSRRLTKEVDDLLKAIYWLELLEEVQILLGEWKDFLCLHVSVVSGSPSW